MLKTWKSAMTIALACSIAVWFAISAWGAINVSFTQIDPVNFPIIKGYILVTDETGNVLKELDASDFTVTEQSNLEQTPIVQDHVDIELIAEDQAAIAVGLVIDRSTSMEEQIADAKQAAKGFISLLKDEDKGAITSFGSSVVSAQAFTHQRDLLVNAVDSISVGGSTALFDALYAALRECGKTSGIKAVVAFTDGEENASDHSLAEVQELAKNVNVPVYMIGLGTQVNTEELRNIADQTGGMYKYAPKASDLLEIYNDIGQLTRQQYLVTYTTHNPKYDRTTRTVTISITAEASTDQDSRTYFVPPLPPAPKISAVQLWSNETLIPWGTSIYAGEPVHITAEISDDVDVKEATLFYRTTQSSGTYYKLRMDNTSGDTYGVTIPKTDIKAPGVDFYITASDGALTATSPSNAPAFFPHQIAVLPNHFPVITHTPVTQAVVGELITIEAEVTDTDTGDNVDKALLYYRQGGHIIYKSVPMENTAGDNYKATIPSKEVSDLGIDYYLIAADTHEARAYDGSDIEPYHIVPTPSPIPELFSFEDTFDLGPKKEWRFIHGCWTAIDYEFTALETEEDQWYVAAIDVPSLTRYTMEVDIYLGIGAYYSRFGHHFYGRCAAKILARGALPDEYLFYVRLTGAADDTHKMNLVEYAINDSVPTKLDLQMDCPVHVKIEVNDRVVRIYLSDKEVEAVDTSGQPEIVEQKPVSMLYALQTETVQIGLQLCYYSHIGNKVKGVIERTTFDNFQIEEIVVDP